MKTIELFQWDLNRSIEVPSGSKAHFASVGSLQALVVMEQGGKASVPNILLQEPKDINVWIVRDGATTDSGKIRITSRPVPSDYVYTETGVETVETLTQAMVAAIESEIAHAEAQIAAAKAQADEATQTANQAITQAQETHKIAEADIAENRQLRETLKAEEAKRATAETNRKAEETKRVEAEAARKSAEATRAANETKRTETFNSNLVSWNSKVDAACKKATDTASKAAQDVKTATDAAIAKTEEATQAAVAKAQTATDNATTAANKAEAAVAKLPLPLGNTLKGEVESTMVSVHDAYPAPLVTTKLIGQSNQVTTTGKNLLDISKIEHGTSIVTPIKNGIRLNAKTTSERMVFFSVNLEAGKSYVLSYNAKIISGNAKDVRCYLPKITQYIGNGQAFTPNESTDAVGVYIDIENVPTIAEITNIQLEEGAIATAYEPYTGGKPSPSPDYPQEITNLNKAEIITTNKNLIPLSAYVKTESWVSAGLTIKNNHNGTFSYNGKMTDNGTINAWLAGGYGIKDVLFVIPPGSYVCSGCKLFYDKEDAALAHGSNNDTDTAGMFTVTRPMRVTGIRNKLLDKSDAPISGTWKPMLEVGLGKTEFMASNYTTTPIDLKDNELCSLPNGVKDEVAIDAEGNVSLIKRIGISPIPNCISISDTASQTGKDGTTNYLVVFGTLADAKIGNGMSCMCNKLTDGGMSKNRDTVRLGANDNQVYVYTSNEQLLGDKSLAHIDNWMKSNEVTIIYELAEPQIIPLGKVELPALPEATSNVWNDGNIPANVYVQYLKDVNIAYTDLENQIKQITAALSVMDTPTVIPEMAWGTPAAI